MAIAKDFARYGLPAALGPAAADVAMGAVQTAVVLTCPLPQYFKGRQPGPAE